VQPSASEGDDGFEAVFRFFVSCGEPSKALELIEAAFDTIALFVEIIVVLALQLAVSSGRDHGLGSHGFNVLYDGVRVVSLIGKHGLGLVLAQQRDGLGAVIYLAAGDKKVQGQAQFIGEQMDLGRQTSSGTPQSLVRAPFLRPVAACWCARTMVESSIRYWFFLSRTSS